jgi:DNA adenine methylase
VLNREKDDLLQCEKPEYVPDGRSFLSWVGGKSKLAEQVIASMPPHHTYVEVFAGAAWVLFRKSESRVEVINDINGELVNLYRIVQRHLEEFVRQFKFMLISREEFARLKASPPETLTDIQRAARYYYLLKAGYGSKAAEHTFSAAPTGRSNFNLLRIEEDLSVAHMRLARVTVERQHYATIIERMDREGTLFYLDPPYWGCENHYGKGLFSREDFTALAAQLAQIKGQFIVSINDTPEIREVFGEFNIGIAPTRWSLGARSGKTQPIKELLITNFMPRKGR